MAKPAQRKRNGKADVRTRREGRASPCLPQDVSSVAAHAAAAFPEFAGGERFAERPATPGRRFVLEKLLGTGGLCEVFAATDLLRREYGDGVPRVAVKRLRPDYAGNPAAHRLLAREFCVARGVQHPGVVRVFDLHQTVWGPCLSMELLEGPSLYDVMGRHPSGLGGGAFFLAHRLFGTLAALHGLGIAHGDVKPANLMLEGGDRLVLFDFNTAEIIPRPGRASAPVSLSLRSALRLTAYSVLHASPERLEGQGPAFADDIFSACCAIYELIEGGHPFLRKTALEARNAAMRPKAMALCRNRQEKLLLRGLSFQPAARPSADELAEAFRPRNDFFHFFPLPVPLKGV